MATKQKAAAVAVASLFSAVCAASGMTPTAGENYGSFARRVCNHIGSQPDEAFNALPEPVRNWFDACVDPLNAHEKDDVAAGKALPALEGLPREMVPAGEQAQTPAAPKGALSKKGAAAPAPTPVATTAPATDNKAPSEEEKAAAKAKKEAEAKAAKAKKEADKAAAKKDKTPNTEGVAYRMRNAVVHGGPEMTFEAACTAAGITGDAAKRAGHAWNIYFEDIQFLRIATAAKAYKKPAAATA